MSEIITMANTYTKLYVHIVFAVKGRTNFISKRWEETLINTLPASLLTKIK